MPKKRKPEVGIQKSEQGDYVLGVPGGLQNDLSYPTHGVKLAGGMTEAGVPTISVSMVFSPRWENGMPAGPEMETPWFAMPLAVFDEMLEGMVETRGQMGRSN